MKHSEIMIKLNLYDKKYEYISGGITLNKIKKIMAIALISVVTIAASGCNLIAKTPEGIANSPVAKVNSDTITRGQLDERMKGYIAQVKQQYGTDYSSNSDAVAAIKQQKSSMRDQMITETLFKQKAKELNITVSDAEITKQYNTVKANYKTDADWKSALSSNGYTEASLKDSIKTSLLITKVVDNLTKNTKITDKQIEDYYKANPLKYTEQPDKIHLAHLLVATQAEAQKAKDRIDKGEDFAKVAKEVSTDTGTKDNGGDLGEVEEANTGYDANFAKAGLALKVGEVSGPVQSQYGWHIIKCISKTEYPEKKLDAVKDEIKTTLINNAKQSAYTKAATDWKAQAKITNYDNNMND